ncbi:TPA: hypothetical protein ACP32N_005064 [Pseudomonas aeruginosa]
MPTKTTGAELKTFYTDEKFWDEDDKHQAWCEDVILEVNGEEKDTSFSITDDLEHNDQVKILDGVVMFNSDKDGLSFETFFKRWRKQQNTAYLSVEAPKDKLDSIKAAIIAAGGKVA